MVMERIDISEMWQNVYMIDQKVHQFVNSVYATETNLSRCVSSAGEHQSVEYISHTLPKRPETFGGFDQANKNQLTPTKSQGTVRKSIQRKNPDHYPSSTPLGTTNPKSNMGNNLPQDVPCQSAAIASSPPATSTSNLDLQQVIYAGKFSHCLYKYMSIMHQQMTSIYGLQGELLALEQSQDDKKMHEHNQRLEELHNLQDRFMQEKEEWNLKIEIQRREIDAKTLELQHLKEQLRAEQKDVAQQREQLYQKMEVLTSQGILISPNLPVMIGTFPHGDSLSSQGIHITPPPKISKGYKRSSSLLSFPHSHHKVEVSQKGSHSKPLVPVHLFSATNQNKVAQSVQVKQQLPFKLASKIGSSSNGTDNGDDSVTGEHQVSPFKRRPGIRREQTSSKVSRYQHLSSGSSSAAMRSSRLENLLMPNCTGTGGNPLIIQNITPERLLNERNIASHTSSYPKLTDVFHMERSQFRDPHSLAGPGS